MEQSPEQLPDRAGQGTSHADKKETSALLQNAQNGKSAQPKGLQVSASIGRVGFQPVLPVFAPEPIFHRQIEPACDPHDIRIDGVHMTSAAQSDYELGALALRQAARRDCSWWQTMLAVIGIDWLFTSEKTAQENLRLRAEQRSGKAQHADAFAGGQSPDRVSDRIGDTRPEQAVQTHAVVVPVWQSPRFAGKKAKKMVAAARAS